MKLTKLLAAGLIALTLSQISSVHAKSTKDGIVFRFATVGDSRQEPGDPRLTSQDSVWLQNTKVLSRMTREIRDKHAQALVFNGDMILGYSANEAQMNRQYAYWRGLVANLMETGTYVLPVPGNHEVQIKSKTEDGKVSKKAALTGEEFWRANMGDLILNTALWKETTGVWPSAWNITNTPAIGSDGITTDQLQLSYSFDSGDIHMTVINTDPVGFDTSAPATWLKNDFAAAKARGAKHFFVFGHKMAYTYLPEGADKASESGFDSRPEVRDAFWDVIEAYDATYFCGHEHVYHASQPRKASGGKAWQVIVGTAGSPFGIVANETKNPLDRMYAWAEVSVYRKGRVHVAVHGFDDSFKKTRVIDAWDIKK